MLAERGHTVLMVDADPQCNLTGMVLDLSEAEALDNSHVEHRGANLMEALAPSLRRCVVLRLGEGTGGRFIGPAPGLAAAR